MEEFNIFEWIINGNNMGNGLVVDGKGDKGFSDLELSRVVQCLYITVLPYMGEVGGAG